MHPCLPFEPEPHPMSAVLPLSVAPLAAAPRRGLLGPRGWSAVLAALVLVAIVAPLLNLVLPDGHPLHLSDYALSLAPSASILSP